MSKSKSNITAIGGNRSEVKTLIEEFEKALREKLSSEQFKNPYTSIDDILKRKYNVQDVDNIIEPDYKNKTEFISKGVRGNFQKANGNVLSYGEAECIISDAIEEELP